MHHKVNNLALAGALTAATVYSVCALLWYVSPDRMLMLLTQAKQLDNLDFLKPLVHVTPTNYLMGVVHIAAFIFIALWIYGCVCSYLCQGAYQNAYNGKGCGRPNCPMGAACTCSWNCTCRGCCPAGNCK